MGMEANMLFDYVITWIIIFGILIAITTIVVSVVKPKDIYGVKIRPLGKLANSDSSIEKALEYLELTNSFAQEQDRSFDVNDESR